jgi:LuxR family transcriptional regulator, maltose regulon positive regulatory protein
MPHSRQLAAIMFTDIQGYTALMQQNEAKAIQARDKHRHIFNSITEKYNGKILQYYGDGTLSIFDSAIDAVQCAIEMQLGFQLEPAIPVRIGIHTGDILFSKEDVIGDGINVASRIESLSVPGSVFVSDKVYDEIKNQESIQTSMLKSYKFKNIEKPIEVYAISNEGLIVPNHEDIHGKTDPSHASMPEKKEQPILATKLYVPSCRPKVVLRPRLIEQLNAGMQHKLSVVMAPAGFGKTTLVCEWIAGCDRQTAWLSLDEGDCELGRFLAHLIATIQTIAPEIGESAIALLSSAQSPATESILTILLNDIVTLSDFNLVLDDYHAVNSEPVDDALTFLLDHLPPQMHVVITTREDPRLPLPRLRARGQLTEIRAADLRFTSDEAATFLSDVMSLDLSAKDVETLEARTEGWIAGLQLAALSMQGREDIPGFIKTFAGHDRYIVDYLVEEVLQRQPEHIRTFLLQTSILDRLSGPLCDAVTGQKDSKKILEALERGNLFVVPLDDIRHWFRYHHLFADVLRAHLIEEQSDQVSLLNLRASAWYEHNDSAANAIRHAIAAKDFERAAALIELAYPEMNKTFQPAVWLGWVKMLPEEVIHHRPVLSVDYAWALLDIGEMEASESRLLDAEKWLESAPDKGKQAPASSTEMVVVDHEQFLSLPATIAIARTYRAQVLGDAAATVKYAQQALDFLPEDDHIQRGQVASIQGLAYWTNGDLEAAHRNLSSFMTSMRSAGNISFAISPTHVLAYIRIAQGRLHEAINIYEQSLQLAKDHGASVLPGTAELYLGLGELYHEQGNLDAATEYFLKSEELGEPAGLPDWRVHLSVSQARLKMAHGDMDGALGLLDEAERQYFQNPLPDVRPIAALRTQLWIKQHKLANALDWAHQQGLSVNDDLCYLHEFNHMTLTRVLIAKYKSDHEEYSIPEAIGLLERLLKAAEEGERMGSVIEILILQALAHQAHDDLSPALESLERALTLAEPEGYVRIFIDEGKPMAQLLIEAKTQGIMPFYVEKLLTAFEVEMQKSKD